MKGLLLKDFYMLKKFGKMYLVVCIIFLVLSAMSLDNLFLLFYPCLFAGMIPVNLLAYDERSKWDVYSATLPYSRAQIVSAKYLMGLFCQLAILCAIALIQGLKMLYTGTFLLDNYLMILCSVMTISFIGSSITLPFMFKYGVEKGRIAYMVMIVFICGTSVAVAQLLGPKLGTSMGISLAPLALSVVAIGVYALSWYMSIVIYQKKEIR